MSNLIMTIAMLCQVNTSHRGWNPEKIEEVQLSCQKYYVKCLMDARGSKGNEFELKRCILKRDE